MTPTRHTILTLVATLFLSTSTCLLVGQTAAQTPSLPTTPSQSQPQPTLPKPLPAFYRNIIVLDPAHGGPDAGSHLNNNTLEKDVTLSFSARLRSLLVADGFTVLSTRDSDPAALIPTDQRASVANHARPLACLLLHATTSGAGVHIVTSALQPPDDPTAARAALPWQTAQASTLPQSLRLANELGLSIESDKLPVVLIRASVPPIDNLTCAAAAIEIAPLSPSGAQPTPVTDESYQQHIAEAIANALSAFRDQNTPSTIITGAAK